VDRRSRGSSESWIVAVVDRRSPRQGDAQEPIGAAVDHTFEALDLDRNRLEVDIDPWNEASAWVLERMGFRHEGLLWQRWTSRGSVTGGVGSLGLPGRPVTLTEVR
jgi:RimJ/RimL family protein N-acetyltransferase